ncbi:MAG TPA: hypothetical protein VIK92_05695 [Thermaerobacter sp.]
MNAAPVVVELVGVFPLFYRLCPKGFDWGTGCAPEWPGQQLRDYPPEVQAQGRLLEDLVQRLVAEFGGRIQPVSVPLASFRGLWLSLRYGIRTGEVVVVAGGRAVRASDGYEAVRAVVAAAVGAG